MLVTDPTGNWKGFQQDDNADGTADLIQIRTANTVNEITDITNTTGDVWATPTYDPNGNSLAQPRPDLGPGASMTGVYDAWNRMVKVLDIQIRTANAVNEITDITNTTGDVWATPTYDPNGNSLVQPRPDRGPGASMTGVYDAWNRMVIVLDSDTLDVLLENQFDGRNFRIVAKEYASGILARTRDYYFTDAWQCVEEHVDTSNTPRRQYVWGMRYIDDLVLRDRDISPSGGLLGERLYYLADANWNTTAVVSDSGNVQERYEYTPYGYLSVLEANFTPKAISSYSVHYTYTSREWIPDAGLYYFRNRWYDAQLGRFSSRDPIGFKGSRYGLYEYVLGRVLAAADPWGLETFAPPTAPPTHHPFPPGPIYPTTAPRLPPLPIPPPPVTGTACRLVATRVCVPVAVGYTSYQCGKLVSTYTTVPVCKRVVVWWCTEDDDTEEDDHPCEPGECWCCSLQQYPDVNPGSVKSCGCKDTVECWEDGEVCASPDQRPDKEPIEDPTRPPPW